MLKKTRSVAKERSVAKFRSEAKCFFFLYIFFRRAPRAGDITTRKKNSALDPVRCFFFHKKIRPRVATNYETAKVSLSAKNINLRHKIIDAKIN